MDAVDAEGVSPFININCVYILSYHNNVCMHACMYAYSYENIDINTLFYFDLLNERGREFEIWVEGRAAHSRPGPFHPYRWND